MVKSLKLLLKISAVLIVSCLLLASCAADDIGDKYVGFAKCLTEKGIKMYGTYWCPHCKQQKEMFGKQGFAEIVYTECDPKGPDANPTLCASKGIQSFPTWEFDNGLRLAGEVTLERLAEKSGCELPPPAPAAK